MITEFLDLMNDDIFRFDFSEVIGESIMGLCPVYISTGKTANYQSCAYLDNLHCYLGQWIFSATVPDIYYFYISVTVLRNVASQSPLKIIQFASMYYSPITRKLPCQT